MSSEIQEKYLGFLITGFAVGDGPKYRCAGRVHRRVDDGWVEMELDQLIEPRGEYKNEREAAIAGLKEAQLWIISHPEMRPAQQEEER